MTKPYCFERYIKTETCIPKSIKKVSEPRIYITVNEAIEDFSAFKSIILYAYSGRQYWESPSLTFNDLFSSIDKKLHNMDSAKISIPELCDWYHTCLKGMKIVDNHLTIYTLYNGIFRFGAEYAAYFTDVTVEKDFNSYRVIQSNDKQINVGSIIDVNKDNLFKTLSPSDKEYYLVGIRSWTPVETISVECNGKEIQLQLHKCRASANKFTGRRNHFIHSDVDGICVVTSNTFELNENYTFDMAKTLGKNLQSKKALIWNLSDNSGGTSDYADYFIRGLNGYSECNTNVAILHSNYTDASYNNTPYYKWDYIIDEGYDYSKSMYKGFLYVIMNSRTASSGETAIGYAKSVEKCLTFGENSYGCGVFGELKYYQLPYSKTTMAVPSKIFLGDFEEGKGYTPDYWVDSIDVLSEVLKWLKYK